MGIFNPSTGGSFTPKAPTVTVLNSIGTRAGELFVTGGGNSATVGATYTNNGNTFTVLATAVSTDFIYMSGSGAPTASGTLTKATGIGDATISFLNTSQALAIYTTPSTAPLYLKISMAGGGGGGAGASGSGGSNGGSGGVTTFGFNTLVANGGTGGIWDGTTGSAGGNAVVNSPALQLTADTGQSSQGIFADALTGTGVAGGNGGNTFWSGAGQATAPNTTGGSAIANTGSGGSGGGVSTSAGSSPGPGGGAAGSLSALLNNPGASTVYYYTIGSGGTSGNAGVNGQPGGTGAAGRIVIEELYQ